MTTNSANTANTAIAKETVEANGAQSQRTNPPTLRLDNVSYAYAKGGKRVLKNISHDFQAGKVHAITGPSGAGKTTLLSLISGLATPTEGIVLVDGADLSERDRYRFRSHDIGVIFQNFNLLPNLTVAENIILSMDVSGKTFDKSKRTIVEELLEQVHLPKEYANERILHLSGGEQQRVAIARALSYGPSIIVADEPTGNLDLATQDDIMGIFRTLAHDGHRCVIIVTHHESAFFLGLFRLFALVFVIVFQFGIVILVDIVLVEVVSLPFVVHVIKVIVEIIKIGFRSVLLDQVLFFFRFLAFLGGGGLLRGCLARRLRSGL
jgi:putative ABC transport system ATP-binding protein